MLILGGVWSLLVFTITSPLLFPNQTFERWAEFQVQDFTRGATLIDLSETRFLGLAGLSGKLDLYKGTKQRRSRRSGKKASTSPPVHQLSIDHFNLRPRLFSALLGKAMVDIDLVVKGEEIEGAIGFSSDAYYLELDTQGFDLAPMPGFDTKDFTSDFAGKLSIISDLVLSRTDPKESSGELKLTFDDLQFFNTKLKDLGFDLMPMAFSESVLNFRVEDGRAIVTEGRFPGDLIDAEIEGAIILNKKLSRSRLSLKIKAKILDSAMDNLLKTMSTIKRARDDEGYYHFRGSGTVSNPRFMLDRSQSRGSSLGGDDDFDKSTTRGGRRSSTSDDATERRKKRRERIKKRRERMKERRRKRRERESRDPDDDFEGDDAFPDDGPSDLRGNKRRVRMEPEFIQGQDQPEVDFPPDQDEYEEEVEPENGQEDLEDLGYVNE
jgi:type II secretion system protein N